MKTDWKYAIVFDHCIEFVQSMPERCYGSIIEIDVQRYLAAMGNMPCQIFVKGQRIEYDFLGEPIDTDLNKYAGPFSCTRFRKRPYLKMGWHELKERTPCTIDIYNVIAITETADVLRARYA